MLLIRSAFLIHSVKPVGGGVTLFADYPIAFKIDQIWKHTHSQHKDTQWTVPLLLIGVSFAALFTVCLYSCCCLRVYACACICKHVCFFLQQMSHPVLKNHHIPSHHPLRSCEGARLPALSSQSSRLLAVECWEYPERKGKWHHSGDLPCWATLPAGRSQQAREPTGETAGPLGQKTVIRMCFLEKGERREVVQ